MWPLLHLPDSCHLHCGAQGELLLLAMQLMDRGSLRVALQSPEMREELRWGVR